MRKGYRVYDVDAHVTPSVEVLTRYASQALKDRLGELKPYMRTMNSPPGRGHPLEPWTTLKINPIPYNRIAGEAPAGEKTEKGGKGAVEGRVQNVAKAHCTPGIQHDNPDGRVADMDVEGVDVNVLIPGTWASAASALDKSLQALLYEAYHTYMTDFCGGHLQRLKGLLLLPGDNIEFSLKQLDQYGKAPWVSCVWPVLPEGLPIDHPQINPIWERMNDLHLPIIHHSFFYEPPYFPGYRDIWGNAAIARTAAHPWGAQRLLAYVIAGGILDRYPNINVGFSETGHGWLPYWLLRLDSQVHYVAGVVNKLKHQPSEYAKMGRIYCCIETHEGVKMTKAVNDILGDGCLMYSSDFPHPECDWPNSVDNVLKWEGELGQESMRKLLGGNAERYLRLS